MIGYHYLHTALDDYSRVVYSELLADERKGTAAAFWRRAYTWFAERGIIVHRVLTDDGSCYRSTAFADSLGEVVHKRTRPYRPQTNGIVAYPSRAVLYVLVSRSTENPSIHWVPPASMRSDTFRS